MKPRIAVAALVLLLLACTGSSETQESMPIIRLHQGQYLLEERILEAKIIARVTLRSHEVMGAQFPGSSKYRPAIKFTFDALEYLKGTGGGELVAYAYGDHYYFTMERDTAKEAVDLWSSWISGYRDGRWDDRQAIIFLRQPVKDGSYVIGFLGEYEDSFSHRRFVNRVTIADDENRAWLPAAASAQGSDGNAQEQHFLLEDPDTATTTSVSGAVGSASAASTISKASLKSRIAAVEAELAANNTDAYRNCLLAKYEAIRTIRYNNSRGIQVTTNYDVKSGLAAGTEVDLHRYADDTANREWYEGKDKDLFTPKQGVMYTSRPLPAGEYRFYHNDTEPGQDCGYSEEQRTEILEIVTVTAPVGTLAESFFDPYASLSAGQAGSTAIVGTTTVGTISWQSGEVTADLTRSVTGHALDFIDLTGTTVLSLSVADAATTAAGALTWAVSEQPWKAGDKLMLRIRK